MGIVLGICLAFPVLIIATNNLIVGFIATIVICLITVCVIGVIPLVGWKLGVSNILIHQLTCCQLYYLYTPIAGVMLMAPWAISIMPAICLYMYYT